MRLSSRAPANAGYLTRNAPEEGIVMGMLALRRGATNLHRSRIQNQAASGPGCAGVLLGPGTVDGSQGQIQRCSVVQRPGVAAAIVTESEDGGEFQNDVGIGRSKGDLDVW